MLIASVHFYNTNPYMDEFLRFYYPLIWILLSIIYNIFGLIVTYLLHGIGLRVVIDVLGLSDYYNFKLLVRMCWINFDSFTWLYICFDFLFTTSYTNEFDA